MPRRIFVSYHSNDKAQAKGFRLLRWNENVDFSFFDRSLLSPARSSDEDYIKRRIREEMKGTSITVVLIGKRTYKSKWVRWEIEETFDRGKALLGIKLKGKSDAKIPPALTKCGAKTIRWNPEIFEEEIEEAISEAGR